MKLCILDNDILEGHLADTYGSFGALFTQLFDRVGARWETTVFHTQLGQYPTTFDDFDAVLLTGSRADSFSDAPWVVGLRQQVTQLLAVQKKMVGVCFGHQLIALCLGAQVSRAPQGWGAGRMTYPIFVTWHNKPELNQILTRDLQNSKPLHPRNPLVLKFWALYASQEGHRALAHQVPLVWPALYPRKTLRTGFELGFI